MTFFFFFHVDADIIIVYITRLTSSWNWKFLWRVGKQQIIYVQEMRKVSLICSQINWILESKDKFQKKNERNVGSFHQINIILCVIYCAIKRKKNVRRTEREIFIDSFENKIPRAMASYERGSFDQEIRSSIFNATERGNPNILIFTLLSSRTKTFFSSVRSIENLNLPLITLETESQIK